MREATAKSHLPMAFLGQTEERDRQFPQVRLLILIQDDKYVGWENLMALNVMRLYINKICGMEWGVNEDFDERE